MKPESARKSATVSGGIMGVSTEEITAALIEAAWSAQRVHEAHGVPLVIWRDGKVVEVPPEEIEV